MAEEHVVYRHIERAPKELIERLRQLGTATLSHYLPFENVSAGKLRPLLPDVSLAGPAFTVKTPPRHNLTLHKALEIAQPGDVLVVDAEGDLEMAVWGGLMSVSAKALGVAGMIVDGAVRDAAEIIRLHWPVWAAGFNPRGPAKDEFGAINVPISCAGLRVSPGDVVVADLDGIAVVPLARVEEVAKGGQERYDREEALAKRLAQGELNYTLGGYNQIVEKLGIREI